MENFWVFLWKHDGLVMWLGMSKLISYRYDAISKLKRMSVGTDTVTATVTGTCSNTGTCTAGFCQIEYEF